MKILKKIFGTLALASLLVLLGVAVFNPQRIFDWWALRDYTPSRQIAQIADTTTMTDKARKVFYVYDPQILDSVAFNQYCTIREVSIVLGCYNGSGIYVFDVNDERLAGVQEVTAAHEMLHASYDRLSGSERDRIDNLLQRQFEKLSNERIQTTIKAYRSRDPGVVLNELHSIMGTEVRVLDPELEQYYSQYFMDRSKLVGLSEKYEQVFSDIKLKVERLDADLTLLKAQIDSLEAELSNRADDISNDKAELDALFASKNTNAYNDRVPEFNYSVGLYNSDLEGYRKLIEEYNTKVSIRNSITVEQNDLIDSLSSKALEL